MIVVSNTGPLIALLKAGHIQILKELFGEIYIPNKVKEEILIYKNSPELSGFQALDWIKVKDVNTPPEKFLEKELDQGESAVIQLALEMKANLVIIDEKKARRVCQLIYDLPIKGTGGILVMAKQKNIISAAKPILESIVENGYFLSKRLVEEVISQCHE